MSYPTTSSASDVWSLRDVYKAEAGGDWPVSAPDTFTSAAQIASFGLPSGTYSVTIGDSTYTLTYESGDKFGNGVSGWLKVDNTLIGQNNELISFFHNGAGTDALFTNSSQGEFRLGNSTSNVGATDLAWAGIELPALTYAVINTMTITGSGSATPDDDRVYTEEPTTDFEDSITDKQGYQGNGADLHGSIWDQTTNGTIAGGNIIIPKPGQEFQNEFNGTATKTFTAGDFSVVSFSAEKSTPLFVLTTSESGDEIFDFDAYEIWVH